MRGVAAGVVVAVVCACGSERSTALVPGDQPSTNPAGGGAAGGGPADTGPATTGGSGGTGSGSTGASNTGGGGPTASPPTAATCTPKPRPACAVIDVDPKQPIACRAQVLPSIPAEPLLPTDTPAQGACDSREYDAAGKLNVHVSRRFDGAGRRVQEISAGTDRTLVTSMQYDGCGHLVASKLKDLDHATVIQQTSRLYGADGLLRSEVVFSGQCQRNDYEYRFDEQGRVTSIFDPYTCIERYRTTYDGAGRLSQLDEFFGESLLPPWTDPTSAFSYSYHPNGAVHEMSWRSFAYGRFFDREYDLNGQLVRTLTNTGPGGTGSLTTDTWTYDSSHRMLSFDHLFDGISCQYGRQTLTFSYDGAGALVRSSFFGVSSPCSGVAPTSSIVQYSHPSAGVMIAQGTDDKGNVLPGNETTTFDVKGNATNRTRISAPDFIPVPVFQRDFSCHK